MMAKTKLIRKKKNGCKHGMYSNKFLADTETRRLHHPKLTQEEYKRQLLLTYCDQPLEFPLSLIQRDFPHFKINAGKAVERSILDSQASKKMQDIDRELAQLDDEKSEIVSLIDTLSARRNNFRYQRKRNLYQIAKKEVEDLREVKKDTDKKFRDLKTKRNYLSKRRDHYNDKLSQLNL